MSFPDAFYRWRPHHWHGLDAGPQVPQVVQAYIEITPFDLVKYEVDKVTGYTRVDRPQRGSSQPPTLYGFIPRTYCGARVGALAPGATGGDHDPLDICVVSERPISRADLVMHARVVGGIQMIDGGEADDKIIAVLHNDLIYGAARQLDQLPPVLIERLRHYFQTYKLVPGSTDSAQVVINGVYGADHAQSVVQAAIEDYDEAYGAGR